MRTTFCDLLGIDLPIAQAPIGGAAVPALALWAGQGVGLLTKSSQLPKLCTKLLAMLEISFKNWQPHFLTNHFFNARKSHMDIKDSYWELTKFQITIACSRPRQSRVADSGVSVKDNKQ